jgi:hypothetical protein
MASLGDTKDDVPDWLKEAKSLDWAEEGGVFMVSLLPKPMQKPVTETVNGEPDEKTRSQARQKEKPSLQPQRFVTNTGKTEKISAPRPAPEKPAAKTETLDRQGMEDLVGSVQ